MLDAVTLDIGPDAVVLASAEPLAVASTAVVNGGFTPTARAIINLHVGKNHPCADPAPAALLNAMLAATEAKALALFEAGVVCRDGSPATGTSTDAVVIAATGRGIAHRFGGPATDLGWCVARATRNALVPAIARWKAEHS